MSRCVARLPDGTRCAAEALNRDPRRGGPVCDEHQTARPEPPRLQRTGETPAPRSQSPNGHVPHH